MILKALRTTLLADSDVTDLLATYGGAAAVFTVDPIPDDCELPAVVLALVGGTGFGTRGQRGGEQDIDIRMYSDKSNSTATLRQLGWAVWAAINRSEPSIVGYGEVGVTATPPVSSPDADDFPGLTIRVVVRFLED